MLTEERALALFSSAVNAQVENLAAREAPYVVIVDKPCIGQHAMTPPLTQEQLPHLTYAWLEAEIEQAKLAACSTFASFIPALLKERSSFAVDEKLLISRVHFVQLYWCSVLQRPRFHWCSSWPARKTRVIVP